MICYISVCHVQVSVAPEAEVVSESPLPPPPGPPAKKHHPPHALKPVHIQEAVRRLEQTQHTAPMATLWVQSYNNYTYDYIYSSNYLSLYSG